MGDVTSGVWTFGGDHSRVAVGAASQFAAPVHPVAAYVTQAIPKALVAPRVLAGVAVIR